VRDVLDVKFIVMVGPVFGRKDGIDDICISD
jgi:hypothetical protein